MSHSNPISHTTATVGARGRLVLPAVARRELGITEGSRLLITIESPGVVRLTSAEHAADSARGLLRQRAAGRSLADELIEARRREAKDE